jgi:hypothetical protein
MFQYNFYIHERCAQNQECDVTSLAILADDNPNWRPGPYVRQSAETELHFRFAVAKLLDMEVGNEELLQKGKNPFAWIVRAHLDSLATRKDTSDRFQRKKEVAQLLHKAGFSKNFARETLAFCDWILKLPKEYEDLFKLYLEELEGEMGREYVPTYERQARSEGRQEGKQETFSEVIARGLQKRLSGGSEPYIANIANLSEAERNELFDLILDTTDVEKIKAWFASHPVKKSSKKQAKN